MPSGVEFVLVVILTLIGCFALYEFVIKRVNLLRPLFGLKLKKKISNTELNVSGSAVSG
jgi:hypothetical protein